MHWLLPDANKSPYCSKSTTTTLITSTMGHSESRYKPFELFKEWDQCPGEKTLD